MEGVKIEEVSLRAGDAILLIEGKLLTPDQNTSIMLTDFPIALLQPLFKSVPALQNAAPAIGKISSSEILLYPKTLLERFLSDLGNLDLASKNKAYRVSLAKPVLLYAVTVPPAQHVQGSYCWQRFLDELAFLCPLSCRS